MIRILKLLIISLCCFTVEATAVVADPSACLKDLQLNFFQTNYVTQALSLYSVPEGLWTPIIQDLQKRSLEVPYIMKQMTKRMVPNPIAYPIIHYEAAKILKAALYQVFTEVMRHYYITEHPTLDYIFDYILSQEIPRMVNCFGEEVRDLLPDFE